MADWSTRSKISGDVVFFEYVTSELAQDAPVVFVWDLDKTYLDTHFESLRGLYRTIIEKAFQKRNVPGTSSLVRALTFGKDGAFPIYFITASPPQMEEKIREKLELDGIKPYGIFCKDNLKNLRPGRISRLNQQVGYKLQALLQLREILRQNIKQILWGDDSESDAIIYSLYSDICSRRLEGDSLKYILSNLKVRGVQTKVILGLQEKIPKQDPVRRIYINLATDTDPDYYFKFGRRTLPSFDTFQIALDLFQEKHISLKQVCAVAQDMLVNYGFTQEEFARSLTDLVVRRVLQEETVKLIVEEMSKDCLLPPSYLQQGETRDLALKPPHATYHRESDTELWVPEYIDYLHDFR